MQIQGYKPTFEKYKPEALEWAKEAGCSIPLAQMWSDVRAAYTNFFKSCKGAKKKESFLIHRSLKVRKIQRTHLGILAQIVLLKLEKKDCISQGS